MRIERSMDAVAGSSRPGCPARPGDLIRVWSGSSGTDADGAWWWAHTGETVTQQPLDRWYVHLRPEGAADAVAATVRLAEATGVPLSLKLPTWSDGFGRRDAMVIYLPRAEAAHVEALADAWLAALDGLLDPEIPPLTRPIAPGIGSAQDPGGHSYGQLRCAQAAAAVVRLRRGEASDPLTAWTAVGVDPTRPEEVSP